MVKIRRKKTLPCVSFSFQYTLSNQQNGIYNADTALHGIRTLHVRFAMTDDTVKFSVGELYSLTFKR